MHNGVGKLELFISIEGNARAGKWDRQVRIFSHVFHIHKNLKFNHHGLGEAEGRNVV